MIIKGICHVHSAYSYDGKLSLPQIKELFLKNDLQFACMTEHTNELTKEKAQTFVKECRELSDEKFVFISGFEVPYGDAHILMIGADEFISQFADKSALLEWKEKAQIVVLAHPNKNNYKIDETMRSVIDGIEVWNSQYDGKYAPRFRSLRLLKNARKNNGNVKAFAGLDFHREEHFGGPTLSVNTDVLSHFAIVNTLRSGNYTFGKNNVVLSSRGKIKKGNSKKLRIFSFVFIIFISSSKWINKIFAGMGLSFPKKLKQKIRAKV